DENEIADADKTDRQNLRQRWMWLRLAHRKEHGLRPLAFAQLLCRSLEHMSGQPVDIETAILVFHAFMKEPVTAAFFGRACRQGIAVGRKAGTLVFARSREFFFNYGIRHIDERL